MSLHICALLQIYYITSLLAGAESCPSVCTCDMAAISELPINAVLVKSKHSKPSDKDQHLPTYQSRNEVMDETDEQAAEETLGGKKLKAATCILQPGLNLPLFLSLPADLQALTILQGSDTGNLTLEDSHFQELQNLEVLEIHGLQHSRGILRLRNNALKRLQHLQYLNLQHVHLLGEPGLGNKPAPLSGTRLLQDNLIPGAIPFHSPDNTEDNDLSTAVLPKIEYKNALDIVPYNVYLDKQEAAGLSSFAGLESLIFLRAFHCNIKEVNWEMFDGLKKLEYLSLEGNKIPFLHEFAFYGTPNLKHLTISHNRLLSVQSTGFAGLLNLEILDLSYNNISHLSELSLPPFPKLITADFHHNPLELILPFTFQIMNNTEHLYIGGNHVRVEIRPNSFLGLKKLRKLSLNGVNLEVLDREYMTGMSRLKELKMEGKIHELAFDAFAEVPKVQELILKNCSIRKISMDAFFGLYDLLYLDLSHNELVTLPPSLFEQQTYLKEILLGNNKLITLPQGLFSQVPAKLIRLDNNPWHCTCQMNEWQPSQINKVKVRIIDDSQCQTRYDKGSMCQVRYMYQYRYEQSVSPRCHTPSRFTGWSVFHLLRKHLRCNQHKKHSTIHYTHSKQKKHKESTDRAHNASSTMHSPELLRTTVVVAVEGRDQALTDGREHTTESTQNSTDPQVSEPATDEINNLLPIDTDINQNMWTQRNKDKYRLLQQKHEKTANRLSMAKARHADKAPGSQDVNINVPPKIKKKSETHKKWETKMQDTMKRLNKVPTD